MKQLILSSMLLLFFTACTPQAQQKLTLEPEAAKPPVAESTAEADTTIVTEIGKVYSTPYIKDPKKFFKENNRYKDWDDNDRKSALVAFVTEKDGTNSQVKIRKSSGVKKLDDEAIRLVKLLKYEEPATNYDHQPIRMGNMVIPVFFPPQ